jgi:hypothetical protein
MMTDDVYKRGQTYWYKFLFQGQLIRDSAKTNSKTVAREAERARRRELELAVNRIPKRDRTPLFGVAAREWLASKNTWRRRALRDSSIMLRRLRSSSVSV